MEKRISYTILAVFIVFTAGCATNKVYLDPEEVPGLGAVVEFPAGKVVPIKVKRIISGSMIELTNKEKVSYIGVYIPAIYNIPERAKMLNKELVAGDDIRLKFDKKHRDSQGRLLAYVYAADGRLINAELIKQGLGKPLITPPNIKNKELLLKAEEEARGAGRGIWSKDFKR